MQDSILTKAKPAGIKVCVIGGGIAGISASAFSSQMKDLM